VGVRTHPRGAKTRQIKNLPFVTPINKYRDKEREVNPLKKNLPRSHPSSPVLHRGSQSISVFRLRSRRQWVVSFYAFPCGLDFARLLADRDSARNGFVKLGLLYFCLLKLSSFCISYGVFRHSSFLTQIDYGWNVPQSLVRSN